ncbi:Exosome component 3 [Paramecium bursaria]
MEKALIYIALPGEKIPITEISNDPTTLQTSKRDLEINKDLLLSIKCAGWLWTKQEDNKCKIAIFNNSINYYPEIGDHVIAQITGKNSEFYFCSLGNGQTYNLNQLDFEGATKKNKPNLQIGQYLYSRVVDTHFYLRGKLSCINPKSKKEWTTGESLFRELNGGLVIAVHQGFCDKLKDPSIFKEIAKFAQFDVCVGKNQRIWIKSDKAILIGNILIKAQNSEEPQQIIQQFSGLF